MSNVCSLENTIKKKRETPQAGENAATRQQVDKYSEL